MSLPNGDLSFDWIVAACKDKTEVAGAHRLGNQLVMEFGGDLDACDKGDCDKKKQQRLVSKPNGSKRAGAMSTCSRVLGFQNEDAIALGSNVTRMSLLCLSLVKLPLPRII